MNIFYRNGTARITTSGGQFDATSPKELWELLEQLSDPIARSGMEREQKGHFAPDRVLPDPKIAAFIKERGITKCLPGPGTKITLADLEIKL